MSTLHACFGEQLRQGFEEQQKCNDIAWGFAEEAMRAVMSREGEA
jgi:hypothetical protein